MLLLLFSASLHVKILYGKTINVIVRKLVELSHDNSTHTSVYLFKHCEWLLAYLHDVVLCRSYAKWLR